MQFNYVAYTLREGVIKGSLDADNEAEARSEISRMGYKLLSVGIKWQRPGLEQIFPSLFKVGTGELIRFARQLAIMVRGGSSLQRALEMLQNESSNRVMRRILGNVQKTVNEGGSLSSGMAQHPNVFSPRFVSVVEAGEYTGSLAPALEQLSSSMEREYEAIQRAKRTLMMPAFTMAASGLMLIMMLTIMLPPLLETFEEMGSDIPLITRIAIGLVDVLTGNVFALIAGAGILVAIMWMILRYPSSKYALHSAMTRTPIVGPLIVAKELSGFSRTIAMLVGSGVALAMALPLGISGCKNLAIHRALAAGEESLLNGHGLAEALATYSVLPRMWVELVLIGEESNSLGRTMGDLADAYEKELENRLGSLIAILEPLSTIAVGGVVLFMALSMLIPIYSGLDFAGG